MGIASDLRQSVLQAAMQGKLTTQKAEDGDAKDLLLAIRAEKEKLVQEKKIKKGKPLAPITDEEIPFDIPDNWVWCRLEDLSYFIGDGIHGTPQYSPSGTFFFINGNNLNQGKIQIKNTTKKVSDDEASKYAVNLNENTLLVSINGTLGNYAFYQEEKILLGKSACYITLHPDVFKYYLALLIQTSYFQQYALGVATGSTIKNVSLKAMRYFTVPLPPLPEQQRIVARVEVLMKEIDELEQTEKELEAIKVAFPGDMKASLLQAAMEGKLTRQKAEDGDARGLLLAIRKEKEKLVKEKKGKREKPLAPITDEEIPFDIPENWVWCRLNDITVKEIRRGKSPKYSDVQSNTLSFAQKCNTKYDGIQMSLAKYLDESTLKRYTEEDAIIDGDTIINSTGHGTLGRVGFFTDSNNPNHLTIYPDSHVTVVRPSRNCDSRFIHLYIKTQQSWFETKGEGSTNQTELKPAVIKSIVIPLPPLPEQRRIVEKLDQLLPLCDSLSEH